MTQSPVSDQAVAAGAGRPRRPGRPKALDPGRIVAAALDLLGEQGLDAFTLNKLAARLGVSVMTLYTYFPSRNDLLIEVAAHVFGSFRPPSADAGWREGLLAWLEELRCLLERYPVAIRLIKWEGENVPSWLHVWMPLLHILSRMGLSDTQILVTSNWIARMILAIFVAKDSLREEGASVRNFSGPRHGLSEADQALIAVLSDPPADAPDQIYEFGVSSIILCLDDLVRKNALLAAPGNDS